METQIQHLTTEQISEGLSYVLESPDDGGTLEAIVIRPAVDERVTLREADVSPDGGVHGDRWKHQCHLHLPDGRSHPDVQVTLMNARMIDLIAQDTSRWALAGDNMFVDLDLSDANLPVGSRLAIGSAILEISPVPHNGCKKFAQRFGKDAVRFVNTTQGKTNHLRGRYARIVQAGTVRVGDTITRIQ